MFKKIDHIELVPRDFESSLLFYMDTLGFSLVSRYKLDNPVYSEAALLKCNEIIIELLNSESAFSSAPANCKYGYRLQAWEVDDMSEVLNKLETKGIKPIYGPKDLGDSIRVETKDIDDNLIEIRQWK